MEDDLVPFSEAVVELVSILNVLQTCNLGTVFFPGVFSLHLSQLRISKVDFIALNTWIFVKSDFLALVSGSFLYASGVQLNFFQL